MTCALHFVKRSPNPKEILIFTTTPLKLGDPIAEPYGRPVCDTDSQRVTPVKCPRNVRETCVMPRVNLAKRSRNVCVMFAKRLRNVARTPVRPIVEGLNDLHGFCVTNQTHQE